MHKICIGKRDSTEVVCGVHQPSAIVVFIANILVVDTTDTNESLEHISVLALRGYLQVASEAWSTQNGLSHISSKVGTDCTMRQGISIFDRLFSRPDKM